MLSGHRSRLEAGFTLVEILVVLFIVATVMSIGLLSIGVLGDDRELQTEAKRFAALSEVAQDEALMQGREFGIEFLSAGYRFVEYDAQTGLWAAVPGDDTLRLRALPADSELELYLEGQRIVLSDDPAPFEDPDENAFGASQNAYSPHLMVFSSGDVTPYELHLVRKQDDQRIVLRGNTLGAIEFVDADET